MTEKSVRNLFFLSSAEGLTRMLFGTLRSVIIQAASWVILIPGQTSFSMFVGDSVCVEIPL